MALDNQTIYNYSLGAVALFVWFVMYRLFGFIMQLGLIQDTFTPGETANTIIPFILGLGTTAAAFMAVKRNEAANRFGNEVVVELRKVVWPTRKEVTGTTYAVLILVIITALILFVFDKVFGYLVAGLVR